MEFDINAVAKAIEADAGQPIDGLSQSLKEMQKGAGKVYTPEQIIIRETRQRLKLTQANMAKLIHTPLPTLRDWEQGKTKPPAVAVCLYSLIGKHPELANDLAESVSV